MEIFLAATIFLPLEGGDDDSSGVDCDQQQHGEDQDRNHESGSPSRVSGPQSLHEVPPTRCGDTADEKHEHERGERKAGPPAGWGAQWWRRWSQGQFSQLFRLYRRLDLDGGRLVPREPSENSWHKTE